jgi:iron complex transport system substrate-binding protein
MLLSAALSLILASPGILSMGPKVQTPAIRVVTLAPSLTDIVLSLGGPKTLVGVSRFDERPEVTKLPRVGGFVDPSVEAVFALHPDLVLVQPGPGNKTAAEKMAALNLSVLSVPLHTVEDVKRAFLAVGQSLGKEKEAWSRIASLEQVRETIRARSKGKGSRRVLVVYGFAPLVVAGPGSFADELLKDVGAVNAATLARSPFASYSTEAVLSSVPELILDCSHDSAAANRFRELPGLSRVPFEKASRHLMHPGPALEDAWRDLFTRVHGEPP